MYCLSGNRFKREFEKTLTFLRNESVSTKMLYKAITKYRPENGPVFKWLEKKLTKASTAKLDIDLIDTTETLIPHQTGSFLSLKYQGTPNQKKTAYQPTLDDQRSMHQQQQNHHFNKNKVVVHSCVSVVKLTNLIKTGY